MEKKTNNLHAAHRERLRQRFLREGGDSLETHVLLELLLFYSIPRCDTNVTAHRLLDTLGGLPNVFDSEIEQLTAVEGIGENSAILLRVVTELIRRYAIQTANNTDTIDTPLKAGEYFRNYYIGCTHEKVAVMLLNNEWRVIECTSLAQGGYNSVALNMREILTTCLLKNASAVIVAHNHPKGCSVPSEMDILSTEQLKRAFETVGIRLLESIVVGSHDYCGILDYMRKKEKA